MKIPVQSSSGSLSSISSYQQRHPQTRSFSFRVCTEQDNNSPTISVVLCSYQGHTRISKAIQSVLDQTYRDFELIVVDDGSTISLEHVVEEFQDKRIRFFRFSRNRGVYASRALSIACARGRFIALLDDDDFWFPGKLEVQLPFLNSDEQVALVCSGAIDLYPGNQRMARIPSGSSISYRMMLVKDNIITSSVLFKKWCYEMIGGFDISLRRYGDWDCWLRLSKYYEILAIKDQLVVTTMRVGSLQRSEDIETCDRDRWRIIEKHRNEIERLGMMEECLAVHLHSIGVRYLRRGQFRQARDLLLNSIRHKFRLVTFLSLFLSCIGIRDDAVFRNITRRVKFVSRSLKS